MRGELRQMVLYKCLPNNCLHADTALRTFANVCMADRFSFVGWVSVRERAVQVKQAISGHALRGVSVR